MTVAPDEEDPDPPSEEARLFRDAVRGVKPLGTRTSAPVRPRPRPRARFTRADRTAVLRESLDARDNDPELAAGDELVYLPPRDPADRWCGACAGANTACNARSTCTG